MPTIGGMMQWDEEMSVGVIELDADHKELIEVINQLGTIAEDEARPSAIRQWLFALLRHAAYHFAREEAREEKVMAACQYPEIREHKAEHRGFVERINHLHRRLTRLRAHAPDAPAFDAPPRSNDGGDE